MEIATRDNAPQPTPTSSVRWTDRLDRRVLIALTVAGFALPLLAYLWFLQHYGINTIVGDQFDDVTVIRQSYLHGFDWSSLWAQHNENRIFFPNLIVILLSRTTHFNVKVEEFVSAGMLITALTVLILSLRRRSPTVPMLYYCPVAVLGFSFVQWSNTTWGFQIAWYLVLLALMVAIYMLDRPHLTWLSFGAAVLSAVVGSFSSSQGLLIWAAGIILLYHRKRTWPFWVAWIGMAVVSAALYFHHFQSQGTDGSPQVLLDHPIRALRMYLFALGDIVGVQVPLGQAGNPAIPLLGAVIFVVAIAAFVLYGLHRDVRGGSPIGLSLICVGLLFAALITEGRSTFGDAGAGASRYTTMDLLIPMGIYLTLIDRSPLIRRSTLEASAPTSASLLDPSLPPSKRELEPSLTLLDGLLRVPRDLSQWGDRYVLSAARMVIVAIIVLQVLIGLPNGLHGARSNYLYQAEGAHVLLTINRQSDGAVRQYLYLFRPASFIRRQTRTLEHYHLSLFAP